MHVAKYISQSKDNQTMKLVSSQNVTAEIFSFNNHAWNRETTSRHFFVFQKRFI